MKGVVFSFFAQCLQPIEQQTYKNLSAKKDKKTYRNICKYENNNYLCIRNDNNINFLICLKH